MSQTQARAVSRAKPGRSRADGARSRGRILDAAEQLLSERGYAGTGIAAISQASGLPASSIYWHFKSKQDLTGAVVERATERWVEALEASEPGPKAPTDAIVAWISRSIEEMGRRLPFFMRLSLLLGLELGPREPALMERLRRGRVLIHRVVRGSLERVLAAEGIPVDAGLADEIARLAMAFSQGAFISGVLEPESIDPGRIPEYIETGMRAIMEARMAEVTS
ncbi:MAG: TetR/AcrR family transcriptional regulator [bacterium]|nr:TetR/AcrR family transcriptional regulator [bacterium]MCP5067010.1 TetR/AcrR family transcriptional regulator [bacterium]